MAHPALFELLNFFYARVIVSILKEKIKNVLEKNSLLKNHQLKKFLLS